jgi:hypothetical protein
MQAGLLAKMKGMMEHAVTEPTTLPSKRNDVADSVTQSP